ncbi:MAG: ComEA family DNA-binding protein [bacterium]
MIFFLIITVVNTDFFETEQQKDFEIILLELENLKNNPVDLNTANLQELAKIPFLKVTDCLRIIGYREKYGLFESVDDLLIIKGLDPGLIELIKPYVAVKTKPMKWKGVQNRVRFQKTLQNDKSEEYYSRTTVDVNDYRIFLVTEKDPYETSILDYYSAGILIDEGKRRFALGNYNLDFGSGVMLSSIGSFFQGVDFRMLTSERGIIPYTSAIENGGFFGAALSDTIFLNYCLFYSNQKLDGRIDTSGYARSFDQSGNHIDSASIAHRDRIREEIFGYNLRYKISDIQLSQRTYWAGYEPAFVCVDSMTGFYGKKYWLSGVEAKYYAEQFVIFAEIVRSFQNRLGSVFGWSGLLPYNFEFNIASKYFNPGFYAPKGAEAEKDYLGAYFDLSNHSRLIDAGTTINIHTNNDADTNNYDIRLNFGKTLGITEAKIQFHWLYQEDHKELSGSKVFVRIKPRKFFYLDLRLEDKYSYEDILRKGIFGGIELGLETKIVSVKTRYGMFETDAYSTRIYVYEPDLPGIINNRMVYGKGSYGFILLGIRPVKKINISLKYLAMSKDSMICHIGTQVDIKL